jgi:alkaline phosphatase D
MTRTRRSFLAASLASAGTVALSGGWRAARAGAAYPSFGGRDPFTLGVASGYPTSNSVVLWTRLAPWPLEPGGGLRADDVAPVEWEVATDDKMAHVVRKGIAYATAEWAHSIHAEPDGLEPGRDYWYRFRAGTVRSPIGRTRTAPAPNAPLAKLKLAVASCQQYEQGYFTAYRHIVADNPDLILHVGDYIYELTWGDDLIRSHGAPETYTLDDYRQRYALYKSDPDLAAAHAACPWLVTWDDHEVDNDYAGSISEENDDPELFIARRAAAYRAYYEHMPLPRRAVPFGGAMRLYAQRAFGDLASIFMLDQRQYRSPEACPPPGRGGGRRVSVAECPELERESRQMLGERQESWLFAALANSKSRWNLLGQGTVMSYLNEQDGGAPRYSTDAWNGYPAARARLIDTLAEKQVPNPVVLSGDIHSFVVSGLHRKAANLDTPIVASELVTTSISSQGIPQKTMDAWAARSPNLLLADSQYRGYLRLALARDRLQADLVAMDSVKKAGAAARTLRSFVIETNRPGPIAM